MLSNALQQVIKPGTTFSKLRKGTDPYPFHDWATDKSYFRYSVKHKGGVAHKRINVYELENLLKHVVKTNQNINRSLSEYYCSIAASDGPCGYAVIAAILQLLGVGQYIDSNTGIRVIDVQRLKSLLV